MKAASSARLQTAIYPINIQRGSVSTVPVRTNLSYIASASLCASHAHNLASEKLVLIRTYISTWWNNAQDSSLLCEKAKNTEKSQRVFCFYFSGLQSEPCTWRICVGISIRKVLPEIRQRVGRQSEAFLRHDEEKKKNPGGIDGFRQFVIEKRYVSNDPVEGRDRV